MARSLAAAIVVVTCAVLITACAVAPERPAIIRAAEVAEQLEAALGYPVEVTPPPALASGLPQLAATVSGGNRSESVTALVFYDSAARVGPVGRRPGAGSTRRLARHNVLVLYRREAGVGDRTRAVARALANARPG